jgi:hypothetical protein
MSTPAAWDKRLRSLTLRSISQNQSLGACYFPYEVLAAPMNRQLTAMQFTDAVAVLEELANHGRCVIALPGDAHVMLYFVEPEQGRSRVVWYERPQRLSAGGRASRWMVSLNVDEASSDGKTRGGEPIHEAANA